MKVLILTITAGQGHNSCAQTISECFNSMGIENQVLDTYEYISELLQKAFSEGYLLSIKSKHIYSQGYKMLESRTASEHSNMRTVNRILAHKLAKFIDGYAPDAIVYTHVMAGFVLDILKEDSKISCPLYGIVTDFTMHPYWDECLRTEHVVLPNQLLINKALTKGLSENQLLTTGIPISEKFAVCRDKEEVRCELGLNRQMHTVLLMGGSMGYGRIGSIVEQLDAAPLDLQIISVCGNNSEMKESIDKMSLSKPILNFGFTRQISDLMDAADCIITKPGGLTTSEALAKKLPLIIVNPIPGQEDRNTEFLLNSGVAMKSSPFQPVDELLYELFSSQNRLIQMRNAMQEISKPHATRDLCEQVANSRG
jgi:processive 1,2-diacylglycerol beta-glucosyltransferase